MAPILSRRDWLAIAPTAALGGVAVLAGGGAVASAQTAAPATPAAPTTPGVPTTPAAQANGGYKSPAGRLHADFPSHDPAQVREVVGASHAKIDRVRELVEASPALAKAAWDWGFGDWETALGAASHMGRRDIAELLIAHGARPDLFTFAMLGNLPAVRACVEAVPGVQRVAGPHGITLLQHARNGGPAAAEVAAYLESLGDADQRPVNLAVTDEQRQVYIGRYTFGDGPDDAFEILLNRQGELTIKRGERFPRTLLRVEEHAFAPGGAPAVRVRFGVEGGRAVSLTIHDPVPQVTAQRAG